MSTLSVSNPFIRAAKEPNLLAGCSLSFLRHERHDARSERMYVAAKLPSSGRSMDHLIGTGNERIGSIWNVQQERQMTILVGRIDAGTLPGCSYADHIIAYYRPGPEKYRCFGSSGRER